MSTTRIRSPGRRRKRARGHDRLRRFASRVRGAVIYGEMCLERGNLAGVSEMLADLEEAATALLLELDERAA